MYRVLIQMKLTNLENRIKKLKLMAKEIPQWLTNLKKLLNANGMDGNVPKFFVDYMQGYVDQLAKQRNEICTLQEEKREYLRITEDLNRQRAEIQIRCDRLQEELNHANVNDFAIDG